MSMASNTQQASTRGGKGTRNSRQSADDEAVSAKALKTLKELFSDWTEEDLKSALRDSNNDLDKTIDYISEGHATQWGEVKSRKKQPSAKPQKPKQQARDESKGSDKSASVPRPASFRGGVRGGAARGRGSYANVSGGRGRSAQTAKAAAPAVDSAAGWDVIPPTESNSAEAAKPSSKAATASKPATNGTAAPAKPAPMSWASIAKRGVKQPSPETAPAVKPAEDVASETKSKKPIEKPPAAEATETVSEIVEETKIEDGSVKAEATVVAEAVHVQPEPSADQAPSEPEKTAQPTHADETPAISSPKKPAPTRRLHQDAPVVMPSGKSTLERIGVQFGSLSIGGVELGGISEAAPEQPKKEPLAPQAEAQKAAPVAAACKIDAAPTAAPAEPASQQGPLTTYLQQQQQQKQQQQQAHSTANAASISQMPLPNDYGAALYGAEAQRNMMGFYDNYGYGQFVANKDTPAASSVSEAQPSTSTPQAASANGSTNLSQAGLFPQMPQPFGMNHGIPYYPYYYNMMQPGSQYHNPAFGNNPALAAAYAQPFMKQGMYPMYPGATPQGLQGVGSQQQPQQPSQQATQHPNLAQQQSAQQAGVQQQSQQGQAAQQANAQQAGKGSAVGAQNSAASYGNINAQKAGNPYGHYAANIASGFGMYEQDPTLSSPQQFGLGGIPGILSASKGAGGKDAGSKSIHPAGTAPVVGGTTYYNAPQQQQPQQQQPQQAQQQQQLGGYPSQQSSNAHPQGFSHQQQAYYNPYMNYSQNQSAPHMYQQQPLHPAQAGQQPNRQYWEKQ
ncbi:RNAPII degradation factor [Coemansia sp. RSA 1821]|nr:RNAPII degradation factor [Coemansia sp. RSA 1821]